MGSLSSVHRIIHINVFLAHVVVNFFDHVRPHTGLLGAETKTFSLPSLELMLETIMIFTFWLLSQVVVVLLQGDHIAQNNEPIFSYLD